MTETVDWSYFTKHGGDVPGGSKDWFRVGEQLMDRCPECGGTLWIEYGFLPTEHYLKQFCLCCGWNDPLCPRPEKRMWKKVRFA